MPPTLQKEPSPTGPGLMITVENTTPCSEFSSLQPSNSPTIEVPAGMSKFDQENFLDHRDQFHILVHFLKVSKYINRTVYQKFTLILKKEGYIKEDWNLILNLFSRS